MDYNLEKLISEGKALVGYDQEEVKEEIINLQQRYIEKKNRLVQELEMVKAENDFLKEKLTSLKDSPPKSHLMEEISSTFMTVFLEDTLSMKKWKDELEAKERPIYEAIKLKRLQKEQALRRVQEATEFLKSLQEDFSFGQKAMDQ